MPSSALRQTAIVPPATPDFSPETPRLRLVGSDHDPDSHPVENPDPESAITNAIGLRRPWMTWSCLITSMVVGVLLATLNGCHWASASQNTQGAAMYNQGQYTGAMEQFRKAIASNPTDPDSYYNLAATTHHLGNQRQDPNLIRQSESLYNQCLDHDPNHVDAHRGLAVLLVDSGRPDRAFALMKNWASQNPTLAEPRIELARLYEEHGESQVAMKYLEDAVQSDANNPRAWLALARLREQGGDPIQALQNYQRALQIGGGALGPNSTMATERVAALSRQINSARDAQLNSAGTQMATPAFGSTRY